MSKEKYSRRELVLSSIKGLGILSLSKYLIGCGEDERPQVRVEEASKKPNPNEIPKITNLGDNKEGILKSKYVTEFKAITEELYSAGIGYDNQNIRPEINMRLVEAVDFVGKRNLENFKFIEIPSSRFTIEYQKNNSLKTSADSLFGNNFSELVNIIESPEGFKGKSYAFGRFPIDRNPENGSYLYYGLMGEDLTGYWLGEKWVEYKEDSLELEFIKTCWEKFI